MLPEELRKQLLLSNSETRIRARDAFMLMALWMETFPVLKQDNHEHRNPHLQSTGCVLVSPQDRVVALSHSGEAHAVVRALMSCSIDPKGCDVYVSRFPCALCTKVMVQAGIRKCFFFPAAHWELHEPISIQLNSALPMSPNKSPKGNGMDSPTKISSSTEYPSSPRGSIFSAKSLQDAPKINDKSQRNAIAVQRLITNNPIAFSLFIPTWDYRDQLLNDFSGLHSYEFNHVNWEIDPAAAHQGGVSVKWPELVERFHRSKIALNELTAMYSGPIKRQYTFMQEEEGEESLDPHTTRVARHAMVLAHIAARRTDDPKVGVGAILYDDGQYTSVGWNGFPKKSQHLDYPQAGADDLVDESELKYWYSLHAEQNALLWRNPTGSRLRHNCTCKPHQTFMVTTKMPCDECSPMIADSRISMVFTNRQTLRAPDDPLKLRGLSYDKCHHLLSKIYVFDK